MSTSAQPLTPMTDPMPRRHIALAICLSLLMPAVYVLVVLTLKWLISGLGQHEVQTVAF